jgi:hypothetical protein
MSPWTQLLALAERELELIRGGDIERLPEAIEERARLAATLGQAPASARPVLERLQAVQQQIIVELTLAGAEIVRELGALRRGRGAVDAYRFAAGQATGSVDGVA